MKINKSKIQIVVAILGILLTTYVLRPEDNGKKSGSELGSEKKLVVKTEMEELAEMDEFEREAFEEMKLVFKKINDEYGRDIKPIFDKKCKDCHSDSPTYPWYYPIPGVKQLIDSDIETARSHLDISGDFPFPGHGSPKEDLEEIAKAAVSDSMPPLEYRLMHSDSALTSAEKELIARWTTNGQKYLRESE